MLLSLFTTLDSSISISSTILHNSFSQALGGRLFMQTYMGLLKPSAFVNLVY